MSASQLELNPMTAATTPKSRKVFFLIDNLIGIGGAEGALLRMVKHLPNYGYECAVGSFNLAVGADFLSGVSCPVYDLSVKRIYDWQGIKATVKLRRLIAEGGYNIIHTMFPGSDLWGGPLARMGTDVLLVSGRRDLGIVRNSRHDKLYRWLGSQYDQVQAVSEAVRRATIEKDGVHPERVVTVHNGIELDAIDAAQPQQNLAQAYGLRLGGPVVVAATGHLWPVKGTDVLIRAAEIVVKQMPQANFLIFGATVKAYGKDMIELVRTLGLESNVRLAGSVDAVAPPLKASSVFCQLSRSEGLSNALLEGMACGLPSVATTVGGNPEVVLEGKTGYLVPSEDPAAAADRILKLLTNDSLRRELGENARTRVREHFSVEVMARRMAELYDELQVFRK